MIFSLSTGPAVGGDVHHPRGRHPETHQLHRLFSRGHQSGGEQLVCGIKSSVPSSRKPHLLNAGVAGRSASSLTATPAFLSDENQKDTRVRGAHDRTIAIPVETPARDRATPRQHHNASHCASACLRAPVGAY